MDSFAITITNTGDEDLWFNIRSTTLEDQDDQLWDILLSWNVSDSVQDYRIDGITLIEDNWWISGSSNREDENYFYVFDKWGNLINTLDQPVVGRYGIKDMVLINDTLYCACDENYLIAVDPETGEEFRRINLPGRARSIHNITVDPTSGHFFVSAITNYLFELESVENSLQIVSRFVLIDPRDSTHVRRYGLTWYPNDPDGFPLYIMNNTDIDDDYNIPDISIFKINPETHETRFVTSFPGLDPNLEGRGGICATPRWNGFLWVMGAILDSPEGDEAVIFQLGPNLSWFDCYPAADTLEPDSSVDITFVIDATDLEPGLYGLILELITNTEPDTIEIPITLEILPPENVVESGRDFVPLCFSLEQNFPNPFNSTTEISFTLGNAGNINLTVYDILGREIERLVEGHLPAGRHTVAFQADNLPAGIYLCQLEAGEFRSVRKIVLVR